MAEQRLPFHKSDHFPKNRFKVNVIRPIIQVYV